MKNPKPKFRYTNTTTAAGTAWDLGAFVEYSAATGFDEQLRGLNPIDVSQVKQWPSRKSRHSVLNSCPIPYRFPLHKKKDEASNGEFR